MKYQVIVLLICEIQNSAQRNLTGEVCFNNKRLEFCCFNYEEINGVCTECRIGTTTDNTPGGRCVPCNHDNYGHKCIMTCVCDKRQRCDAKVGCILNTNIPTIPTTSFTYTGTTEPVILPKETVTSTETTSTINGNLNNIRTSISEWIILTLCITGCIILTGFGYLMCTYRKRPSLKSRITNEEVILEPLEPSPYIGVYDEIDENQLASDTVDLNIISQESHYETIDLVSQESLSIATSTGHDDTGYLDPYFEKEEEGNHQFQDRTSQEEFSSTNLSNSDVSDQDNISNNNPYQPLQKKWQKDSHGYEVPVIFHKFFDNSADFDGHVISNSYYNVNNPLQKESYMNSPNYENQKSPERKAGNDERMLGDNSSSVFTTRNLHDYINMHDESSISMINCDLMESCKPIVRDKSAETEQKLFRGEIDLKIESNQIYRDDNDSNSNDYEDAKSCV